MSKAAGLIALAALLCFPSVAQRPLMYEQAQRANLWNDGINVGGLRLMKSQAWDAHAFATIGSGAFHATNDADNYWSAGVLARADQALDRFSMTGSFGFSQKQGSDMCGSMLIDSGAYPLDVLEFTPGNKTLQTYAFSGGVAVDLTDRLVAAGSMRFKSQNYSKRKDLRHVDYKLDMEFVPSLMWRGNGWDAGASLILGKNTESVDAEQIGSTTSSYYAFLDKGLMYGEYETWTGSGLHLDEAGVSGFPLQEMIYGAALQLGTKKTFADVEYRHRSGKAGEKQYVWYRFPTDEIKANLGWRFGKSSTLRAEIVSGRQINNETVLEKETVGGVTNVSEYGSNRILVRDYMSFAPEYEYRSEKFDILASSSLGLTSTTASIMYPLLVSRNLLEYSAALQGVYRIKHWDIEGCLGFGGGKCTEDEKTLDEGSGLQSELFRLDEWNDLQIDYLTSERISTGLCLRYYIRKIGYASLADDFVFAPSLGSGGLRNIVELRFGRNF